MKFVLVAVLVVTLTVSGCSTTRTMTPGVASTSSKAQMHAGDRAKILLKSGEVRNLKVTALDDQTITGEEGKGKEAVTVQIALADVQSVEYRRGSVLRTGGLVLGVVVAVAGTLLGVYYLHCTNSARACNDE
ncbi:MAG: hypothetical protein IT482_00645 [Gammaproteobacteria bacterium]|jgi:uncharacterized protein YceK|nr:hypothetical protein [Gammaproteobacteria bacterium]